MDVKGGSWSSTLNNTFWMKVNESAKCPGNSILETWKDATHIATASKKVLGDATAMRSAIRMYTVVSDMMDSPSNLRTGLARLV